MGKMIIAHENFTKDFRLSVRTESFVKVHIKKSNRRVSVSSASPPDEQNREPQPEYRHKQDQKPFPIKLIKASHSEEAKWKPPKILGAQPAYLRGSFFGKRTDCLSTHAPAIWNEGKIKKLRVKQSVMSIFRVSCF